jgi:glutamate-1-semialdehyde 2,1-aminomutase
MGDARSLDTKASAGLFERALRVLPGGVNSPVRAMRQIGREPIFIERGEGCELVDVDGNRYLDWVGSWGPTILGHAHPAVVEAVVAATRRGTSYGAATAGEVELADEVVARVPSAEMVRMTSSGTEAAMSAVRLARAVTGREVVVKFAGAYHGHSDGLLADAGSGLATLGIPASPGVTAAQTAATVVVGWNDRDAVARALSGHPVAALLAEPIAANMGVVPPAEGFLEFLRSASADTGALLVFDEVITGFRVARGGAQELYGVEPDLTILGKVLGGGLPAAAFAGPRKLMERVAPAGDVYQAGTLSGNPLAVAAGLATLAQLDLPAYERLGQLTDRFVEGLSRLAEGRPLEVAAARGLVTLFFSDRPVTDFAAAQACDIEAHARFCRAMIERGVYPPPSQFEAWFVSLAHDDATVDRTLEAAAEALAEALP